MAKWDCPVHKVRMSKRSTQYGMRRQCEAPGCTYAGWESQTGTPADDETRALRIEAHAAFDALWQEQRDKGVNGIRTRMYRQLSEYMGLPMKKTHIGMFDANQCRDVLRFAEYQMALQEPGDGNH